MSAGSTGAARRTGRAALRRAGCPVRLAAALAVSLGVWLGLAPASALAVTGHNYVCQITGTSPGSASECNSSGSATPGGLAFPTSVTVSRGNVWVVDRANDVVDEYDSSGGLVSQQAGGGQFLGGLESVAVNDATQDLYVADNGGPKDLVDVFDSTGAFVAQWNGSSTPSGSFGNQSNYVAVDNSTDASSGDVYVADSADEVVDKLGSTGNPVSFSGSASYIAGSQITGTPSGPFRNVDQLVVDPSGDIYVIDESSAPLGQPVVDEFDPSGMFLRQFTGSDVPGGFGSLSGLAIDPASGHLYVVDSNNLVVDEFDASGAFVTQLTGTPSGPFGFAQGVAVNASGDVYVSDAGGQMIDEFGPDVVLAGVSTGPASALEQTSATVSGTVDPDGMQVSSCKFEYGTTSGYGQSAPCSQSPAAIGSGTSPVAVSASVSGLEVGTLYHYRLDAGNANGTNDGPDQTFVTVGPGFGIQSFDGSITNQDGTPDTQAGSHPYAMTTTFALNSTENSQGTTIPDGSVKDISVNLPAGLVGDPTATPTCTEQQLALGGGNSAGNCPADSQVGVITINAIGYPSTAFPVFNMVPPPGEPAQLATNIVTHLIYIDIHVRTGSDYGLTATLSNVSTDAPLFGSSLTVWGVPADPAHDPQRFCPGSFGTGCSSGSPLKPFLTMPTVCQGPQTTTLSVDSWQNPGQDQTASYLSHDNQGTPIGIDGCNRLDFSPTLSVQPDTTVADSPSGLSVDLHLPAAGLQDPNGLAEANLKNAVVTLPAGMSVNPSAAAGLEACTPAQIGIGNADQPSCPDASKIGTVEVDTPVLPTPLTGAVYEAQQTNNPFGSLLAIYVSAQGDGVLVKLAGDVAADPVTGQLTTTFSNNPQLPFTDFKLDFFGGPHAVLATPANCGTFTTTSDLTPWSTPAVADAAPSDSFSIDSGCVAGFSPSFTAGTTNSQAGSFSPFVLSLSRSDTDENFSGLAVKLPPGMLAKLAGVGECSEADLASISSEPGTGAAQIANPSCPANSQVGTVTTGAGTGPDPFFLGGEAYLTGPYKGAPYGLAVVVPAVAGPLDLGTVVVRQALEVDPTTTQVTDVSDPFPTILDGIPLRIRRIDVDLNRPDFTINPTSCDPMSVDAIASSTQGTVTGLSSHFQVGGCSSLAFSPKLKMGLTGKGKTKSGDHPALVSTLTQPFGQANIHDVRVTLPLSMALDPNNSQHVCNYDVAQAVHGGAVGCPASTIVGSATAVTPLLSQPLTGKVYLVQGIRFNSQGQRIRTLPSLLIPLRGQIALDLRANTSVNGAEQLVTTFSTIPDAAVSKFTLTITGGKKGLLVITGRGRSICGKSQITNATLGAQSGNTETSSIRMSTPCGRSHKTKKHGRKGKSKRHAVRTPAADRRR